MSFFSASPAKFLRYVLDKDLVCRQQCPGIDFFSYLFFLFFRLVSVPLFPLSLSFICSGTITLEKKIFSPTAYESLQPVSYCYYISNTNMSRRVVLYLVILPVTSFSIFVSLFLVSFFFFSFLFFSLPSPYYVRFVGCRAGGLALTKPCLAVGQVAGGT